ncbi:hypothetical protein HD554DRAFT_2176884 [Boletus coccyginus]|nr:hypothetical protein HD554DRAFT_2176884 [Boletus coccyginus]
MLSWLLAAILHLGDVEFTIDHGRGVDTAALVKKELCTVFLDPDGASDNRDDLSKTLYSLLFAWLNEYINHASAGTTLTPS